MNLIENLENVLRERGSSAQQIATLRSLPVRQDVEAAHAADFESAWEAKYGVISWR